MLMLIREGACLFYQEEARYDKSSKIELGIMLSTRCEAEPPNEEQPCVTTLWTVLLTTFGVREVRDFDCRRI